MRCAFLVVWSLVLLTTSGLQAEPMLSSAADAYTRATAEGKLVLLHFVDPAVSSSSGISVAAIANGLTPGLIGPRFIEGKIDGVRDTEARKKHNVTELPTLVVLQPDGTELDRLVGSPSVGELAELLKSAAAGEPEIQRLRAHAESEGTIEAHGRLADMLIKRGFYAQALSEYQWCLEVGPVRDATAYRRLLKTILVQAQKLRPKNPDIDGVIERFRQKAEAELSTKSREAYVQVFTFNEALNDFGRNAQLFEELPVASDLRCDLFPQTLEGLVQARRYKTAVSTIDLETLVGRMYPLYVTGELVHGGHSHRVSSTVKPQVVRITSSAVEAALGIGQVEKARRLAGRTIDWTQGDEAVRSELEQAARRSGSLAADEFIVWLQTFGKDAMRTAKETEAGTQKR